MKKVLRIAIVFALLLFVGIAARRQLAGQTRPQASTAKMELLRTPDKQFANLPDYKFEPQYLFVDDPNATPGNKRIRMHYVVSGPANAPTLLMLHGNPSWSFLFRKLVPLINEEGYRTIMIDYVGHGRSDKPTKESDYTYDRHLEWIRQAFEQLDDNPELALDQVVLFGHDYGHPLGARLMAEHFPERFDGFINGNAGLNRGRWGLARRHQRWRQFVRAVPEVPIGRVICRNQARERLALPPCHEDVEAGYDAPYPTGKFQASIRSFPEMVPEDSSWPEAKANQRAWEFLTNSYRKPYMVIWEPFDIPDLRNRRDEYISSIPGAFGMEQPQLRTGHYSPEDDPNGVAGAVIRFLDDIYAPNRFERVIREKFESARNSFVYDDSACSHDSDWNAMRMSPGAELVLKKPIDLSKYEELKIAFRYLADDVGPDAKLFVDVADDGNWTNLLTLHRGVDRDSGDFSNHSTDYGYVRVKRGEVAFTRDARIRFRFDDGIANPSMLIKDVGIYRSK
ncbi:haloalkane dehalogenase [Rubinisphaera brasiliensis]|uniref:Haloalkane dehalogenase n=1 Tax=Rubinisphaera brasiliensis (strain ATCC 49424 / DSM 5305 / JCM 21570 / IAM 15109 / NBRC 103401 / IFAM 1448) TaxID=756272 RepID=F0SS25_RUBBR|nr:haloalkane dehalogenase [Rubinisphaera brasiliensis]ADY61363.1 Haloalkane dehalogenase [Rubinisphaera brasiliensis DSM 5305]